MHALSEHQCLDVTHISGSSAGALVGGFLSSGMQPELMIEPILKIKRLDIWDVGGIGGLLKGQLFQEILEQHLTEKNIENCIIPLGS